MPQSQLAAIEKAKAFLATYGIMTTHADKQEKEIAMAIANRLVRRRGDDVFQVASITMPIASKEGVCAHLDPNLLTCEGDNSLVTYHCETLADLRTLIAPMMANYPEMLVGGHVRCDCERHGTLIENRSTLSDAQ